MVPAAGPAGAAASDPTAIERGAAIYREGTCPVCHHWEGQGNRRGPDLTDDDWLHGDGSPTAVRKAIETGFRHGAGRRFRGKYEMWPLGGMELADRDVGALSAYVWSLHRRRRAADTLTREVVSRIAFGSGADLDFWEAPPGSNRRRQQGIYTSQRFGPPGRRLQVILLDTRYDRGPLWRVSPDEAPNREVQGMGPYLPNDHARARMLSEEQWHWLEERLRQPADLRLLVTSIPAVMEFTGWESWANMPLERQRLIDLIRDTRTSGVLLLSGDTPWSEISRLDGEISYPLWDITSSSLNQRGAGIGPNRHRVGRPITAPNFGYMEIDWTEADPAIRIELRSVSNRSLLRQTVRLSELQVK